MKNYRILLFVMVCIGMSAQYSNAQFPTTTGQHIWSMPPFFATFDNVPPIFAPPITDFIPAAVSDPLKYSGENVFTASNMVHDQFGNPLFFVNNGFVYDKNGFLIGELFYPGEFNENIDASSEVVIVPDPGNCRRFYIIMNGTTGYGVKEAETPFYSILDLDEDNPIWGPGYKGKLITLPNGQNAVPLGSLVPPSVDPQALDWTGPSSGIFELRWKMLAASKQKPDGSRLLFVGDAGTLYSFRITAAGITYNNRQIIYNTGETSGFRAEMELHEFPDGHYRIAWPFTAGVGADPGLAPYNIYSTELDVNGNVIPATSHLITLNSNVISGNIVWPEVKGLEFSPNGNYLYFNHKPVPGTPNATNPVEYYNFTTSTRNTISSLSNPQDWYKTHIEMGEDGHMYWIKNDGTKWGELDNPDFPLTAVFTEHSSTGTATLNYPTSGYNTSFEYFEEHTLPDQVDGMNYFDYFFQDEQCCIDFIDYDADDYTATSGTWNQFTNPLNDHTDNIIYVHHKLTIPAGVTVTISNMQLYFAPDAWIEVSRGNGSLPGGRLILNNTLLSADIRCTPEAMWRGIEVHGYQTASQLPYSNTQQGKIEVLNNSIIEHALKGIIASRTTTNLFTYDFSYDGGIIRAKDATFRNNWYDVEMRKYTVGTVNQSFFTNCTFVTDDALNIPTINPANHVQLNDLLNITFKGCDFKNTYATDVSNIGWLGNGINAMDAKITIQDNCTSLFFPCPPANVDHTNFYNLRFGILVNNSNPLRTVTCTDANFTNNRRSILLSGVNFAMILRNTFDLYKAATPNSTSQVYGLYLNSCNGYRVENNLFQDINHATITAIGNSYGVIVNNSGPYDNEIYKNTFQNLYIGGQSQGINACITSPETLGCNTGPGQRGLRWKCNTFNDQMVFGDLVVTSGRIAYDQGYCLTSSLTPAGNLFNHDPLNPNWEIIAASSVQQFRYTYHDATSSPNYFDPVNYTLPPVNKDLCEGTYCSTFGTSCCPTKTGVRTVQELALEVKDYRTEIAEKLSLIDGGSTSNLLTYINSGASPGHKKNLLMQYSPYLSDEVLITWLNQNPPPGHIQQVLLANSGISDEVWDVVETMGLPNGIKNSINNARSTFSPMAQLMQNISGLNAEKNNNLYEIVAYYLSDTISISPLDSILAVLDEEEEKIFLITKIDANIEKGEIIEAVNLKNQMVSTFGMDNDAELIDLNLALLPSGSKCEGILNNPVLFDKTNLIAYDEHDVCNQPFAKALLKLVLDSSFAEVIEDVMIAHFAPYNGTPPVEITSSLAKVYPNPVMDELFIESIVSQDNEFWSFITVTITDMQGRVLFTQANPDGWTFLNLPLGNLQAGNYVIKLSDLAGNFEAKTFIKLK